MRKHFLKELDSAFLICVFLLTTLFSAAARAEVTYYYHTDHLGSPLAMTDASKNVVWRRDYKPFGEEINLGGAAANTHKFTGKEFDAGTGLYYYGARYHDPVIGRFITVDLAKAEPGNPQRWNRYVYCLNNPLNKIDPFGLFESPPYLRAIVPGQVLYDYGMTALENGNYGLASFYFAAMTGEQVLFALTLGESMPVKGAVRHLNVASNVSKEIPALRQQYISAVESLAGKVPGMREAGMSSEQIARALSAERRALGEQFKALTPPGKLAEIYERNLEIYGDKLGPTVEWFRDRGVTWEQIIEKASRPRGKDLGF